MVTYADQPLFSSGPHTLRPDALEAQLAEHPDPTGQRHALTRQGRKPRTLKQDGTLIADSLDELATLRLAIEALVNAGPHPLVLNDDQPLTGVVLTRAEFQNHKPLGPRVSQAYQLAYLQLVV